MADFDPRWQAESDVVIVGAGLVGCALAARLAENGLSVTVIDQAEVVAGASGANLSLVLWSDAEPGVSLELTRRAWDEFPREMEELGGAAAGRGAGGGGAGEAGGAGVEFRPLHTLGLVLEGGDPAEALVASAHLTAAGIETKILDPAAIHEVEPAVDTSGVIAGVYQEQASVNPFKVTLAYADRARAAGARFLTGLRVIGLRVEGGAGRARGTTARIEAIETTAGPVRGGLYVLATGAWTRSLALTAGVDLPEYHIIGEACVTEALPPLLHGLVGETGTRRVPFELEIAARDGDGHDLRLEEFAAIQTMSGNLVVGQVTHGGPDLGEGVRPGTLRALAAGLVRRLPVTRSVSIIRSWAKPVPFTPDHQPIIGPVTSLPNLYVASGLKSAFIIMPLLSRLMADQIRTGDAGQLAAFTPDRFATGGAGRRGGVDHNKANDHTKNHSKDQSKESSHHAR